MKQSRWTKSRRNFVANGFDPRLEFIVLSLADFVDGAEMKCCSILPEQLRSISTGWISFILLVPVFLS